MVQKASRSMMQPLARFHPAAYRGLGTSMDQPLAVDRRVVVVAMRMQLKVRRARRRRSMSMLSLIFIVIVSTFVNMYYDMLINEKL